jgi:hypothetical protein
MEGNRRNAPEQIQEVVQLYERYTVFLVLDAKKGGLVLLDYTPAGVIRSTTTLVNPAGQRSRTEGWFEVIVGKSLAAEDRAAKCFGFVSRYDPEPKRRLSAWLDGQGLQEDQPVTFLSDGGDTVRDLPMDLHPKAEHLLGSLSRSHANNRNESLGQGRLGG